MSPSRSTPPHKLLLLSVAVSLVAASCGASGDSDGASNEGNPSVTAAPVDLDVGADGGVATTTAPAPESVEIALDQTVNVGDFGVSFSMATIAVDEFDTVTVEIEAEAENNGAEPRTPLSNVRELTLEVGSEFLTDVQQDFDTVPSGRSAAGSMTFSTFGQEIDPAAFEDAVLVIGSAEENQAMVPFGSEGEAVDLADVPADLTGSLTAAGSDITFTSAVVSYSQDDRLMAADTAALIVEIELAANAESDGAGENWNGPDFTLSMPDGNAIVGDGLNAAIYPDDVQDHQLVFEIATPVEGSYELTIEKAELGTPSTTFEVG